MALPDDDLWFADDPALLLEQVRDLLDRPPWMKDARCREHPEVDYFPARGQTLDPARAVCRGCLVRDECAAFAIDNREQHGVWGGMSERERRAVRSGRRAA